MNGNVKLFLRNALLGVLVIVVTPMLAAFLSSLIPINLLNVDLLLGITLMTIISAGVVAWVGAMLVDRIQQLK